MPSSIDFSIDCLHSARGADLYARCTVERIGRRVAQVQIRCEQPRRGVAMLAAVTNDARHVVALARAHLQLGEAT